MKGENRVAKEIERKFIVTERPAGLEEIVHGEAWVWYLSTEPEKRLRKFVYSDGAVRYHYAEKYGNDMLSREEIEREISAEEAGKLLSEHEDIQDKYLHNFFWDYKDRGYVIEYVERDVDKSTTFITIEVEFENEQEALSYVLPENIHGMDVTFVEAYKMKNYWKRTRFPEATD